MRRAQEEEAKKIEKKNAKKNVEGKKYNNVSNKKDKDKKTSNSGWNFHEEYCI